MRKNYEKPLLTVLVLSLQDIITNSLEGLENVQSNDFDENWISNGVQGN